METHETSNIEDTSGTPTLNIKHPPAEVRRIQYEQATIERETHVDRQIVREATREVVLDRRPVVYWPEDPESQRVYAIDRILAHRRDGFREVDLDEAIRDAERLLEYIRGGVVE